MYIRYDFDVVYKHNQEESYYIYKGHAAHLAVSLDDVYTQFVYFNTISYVNLHDFVTETVQKIPQLINSLVPDSSHLTIKEILSINISILF